MPESIPPGRPDADELKRAFTKPRLLSLAEAEGLPTYAGRIGCPHRCCEDKRACSVSEAGIWHCKHCQLGGSAIDLVMATRGIDFPAAVARLSNNPLPARLPRLVKPSMNGAQLYERLATNDPASLEYLRGRELAGADVRFNVGASGDSWLDAQAARGYRIAVPLRSADGQVLDLQLRSVNPTVTGRDAKRSLCGERPRGTAFGRPDLARAGGRVYIAEGMADTLSLQVAGVVAIGAPGCDQLRHLAKLIPTGTDVVLCPQNDAEDQSSIAFEALAMQLRKQHCTIRQLTTPEAHKDLNDWLRAGGLEAFRATLAEPPELATHAPQLTAQPTGVPLTDTGNAERLVAQHGGVLRHSRSLGWLVWDAKRWAVDDIGRVEQLVKKTIRSIRVEAEAQTDPDVRKALQSHARKSESAAKRRAMLELAESEEGIPIRPSELDADPWRLNCENGTLDLRTGELVPHNQTDLFSKLAPVVYDAAATCQLWEHFLADVQPDAEIRGFLQRFVGYCLTGVIRDHVFVVNYGSGRNGKGVFTDTLLGVLGDYARQVPTELLMAKGFDAHPTDRTELLGRRLAAASETEEGRSLNVALVKALTGGDTISARKMRQDFFTFQPTHHLMLSTNHRPRIRETKNAIWDRMKLVPWDARFLDGDPKTNQHLKDDLRAEWPGILRWAVLGCLAWQENGLRPPEVVRAATESYRAKEDPVGAFLEDCCVLETDAACTVRDLRLAFEQWCQDQGEQYPLGGRAFNERLEARECSRIGRKIAGVQTKSWIGIGLLSSSGPSTSTPERYP